MMVGSDCSLIFCRSLLTNTAATRARSSAFAGFFFDNGSEGYELLRRLDRNVRIAPFPDFREHALLRLLHARNHLIARGAAWELVGFRQQCTLAGNFADGASENIVI